MKAVTLGSMRCSGVVKLVLGLHHQRHKKVKFMMELHHGSSKECGASVGASSHGFPHPCEPVSGRCTSGTSESQNERGVTN